MRQLSLSVFVVVFFITIAATSFAQKVTFKGIVMDSAANKPLAGATVTAKTSNGQNNTVVITDKDGRFDISLDASKVETFSFSYVQFIEKLLKKPAFKNGNIVELGMILLQYDPALLADIIVKGKRPPLAFKIDRQVYKASQFANAAGGSGIDLLKNLPAMSVNGQGELAFRGTSSFLLLLNGRPTQGNPADIIGQLPAGSIESIEVITSPSAAYDAEGKAGVINIIMKSSAENGWMLLVNGMIGAPPIRDFDNKHTPQRYSMDVSAGYRSKLWDISAGLNFLRNDITGYREGDVYTIIGNTKTSFPSAGERSFKRYNYGGRFSVSYTPNQKSNFLAGFYTGKKYQLRVADLLYQNVHENLTTGSKTFFTYYNENDLEKEGTFVLGNISWQHNFNERSSLTISGLYEHAGLSGNTYNNNLAYPSLQDTLQYTFNTNKNPLHAYRFKTDYVNKKNKRSFAAGYQYRYDTQDGTFWYYLRQMGNNNFVELPEFTSAVKAINHIHAGYIQYSASVKQLNYTAGVRLETTDRELLFSRTKEEKHLSLVNFFPSAQMRYALNNRWIIKAGYSRRIRRTNNYELNPFPEREHSETLEQGDAELLPELIGNWEVGSEYTFRKGSFFITPYLQVVKNPIQRVNKLYNDSILNRVFTNAEKAIQIGAEASLNWKVFSWWQSLVGINVYHYKINGSIFNNSIIANNSAWAYAVNVAETFTPGKNWSIQLAINYLSDRPTLQGEDSYFLTPSLSIKKTTSDKRWSFQLQWLNMDAGMKITNRQRITTTGTNFYTTTNYIYEPDQIQFTVSFNLLKRNRKINLPQSEMGEKEF